MTACIRSAHEGCGTRHITVDGADDDLRNALAIASDGVHRRQSGALSVASPASVRFQTRDKCGSGRLRLATDMTEPGERQGRRGGELRAGNRASWHFATGPTHSGPGTAQSTLYHRLGFPYLDQWRRVPDSITGHGLPASSSVSSVPVSDAIVRGRSRALPFHKHIDGQQPAPARAARAGERLASQAE